MQRRSSPCCLLSVELKGSQLLCSERLAILNGVVLRGEVQSIAENRRTGKSSMRIALLCLVVAVGLVIFALKGLDSGEHESEAAPVKETTRSAPEQVAKPPRDQHIVTEPFPAEPAPSDAVAVSVIDDGTGLPVDTAVMFPVEGPLSRTSLAGKPYEADSRGVINVPPDSWYVIESPGYASQCASIDRKEATIRLQGEGRAVLRFVDERMQPVSGLRVLAETRSLGAVSEVVDDARVGSLACHRGARRSATTNQNGECEIRGLPATTVGVQVMSDDYFVADRRMLRVRCEPIASSAPKHEIVLRTVLVGCFRLREMPRGWGFGVDMSFPKGMTGYFRGPRNRGRLGEIRVGQCAMIRRRLSKVGKEKGATVYTLFAHSNGDGSFPDSPTATGTLSVPGGRITVPAVKLVRPSLWNPADIRDVSVDASRWGRVRPVRICFLSSLGKPADGVPVRVSMVGSKSYYSLTPVSTGDGRFENTIDTLLPVGEYKARPSMVQPWSGSAHAFDLEQFSVVDSANRQNINIRLDKPVALVDFEVLDPLGRDLKTFRLVIDKRFAPSFQLGSPVLAFDSDSIEYSINPPRSSGLRGVYDVRASLTRGTKRTITVRLSAKE